MDYKAKYEEALERAKRWADGTLQPDRTTPQGICEAIFPELAESEDEKARKAIINVLEQTSICASNGIKRNEMIAYLEKQKEQKPESASASTIMIPSCWEEMKKAVEGTVRNFENKDIAVIIYDDPRGDTMCYFAPSDRLEVGDKVKIIIVKEDEQ